MGHIGFVPAGLDERGRAHVDRRLTGVAREAGCPAPTEATGERLQDFPGACYADLE